MNQLAQILTKWIPDELTYGKGIPTRAKLFLTHQITCLCFQQVFFKKLMHGRLCHFLDKLSVFAHLQFGFREKNSTSSISMTEAISNTVDN